MPHVDMPLSDLRAYVPLREEPDDFDAFWSTVFSHHSTELTWSACCPHWRLVDVADVRFTGASGASVAGWMLTPAGTTSRLPTVIRYLGYGAGRGLPHQWLMWPTAGFALFIMDTRGQGAGSTADTGSTGAPHEPGFLTAGIAEPDTYFYRRVFEDAVLAVDAVRQHPCVDPNVITVAGVSQGGAIAQAVAGLRDDVVAALIDVPFLTDVPRALDVADRGPYVELVDFCARDRARGEQALRTMRYFDGVNFAARSRVPALYSVGLRDRICPPSTVFAAFNHYGGQADIEIWPYNDHEGGAAQHEQLQVLWLQRLLG